jgi:ribonuclease Z
VNIPHGRILEFCGPAGLAENIRSKILGYTWNLLDPDQLRFVIHEVDAIGGRQSFAIHNTDGFKIRPIAPPELNDASGSMPSPIAPAAYMTKLADGSRIEAVALDHGIPSIAFVIQSPLRFSVRVDELHRLGLNPGPWIRQLQMAAADLRYDDEIDCDGSSYRVGDLAAQLLSYSAPKSLAYVTDIAYSDDNLNRLESAMQGVDLLVCEASFLKEDEDKARSKKHLTTEQACLIAKRIKAKSLKLFHHSKIYARDTSLHDLERERYWGDEDLPVL